MEQILLYFPINIVKIIEEAIKQNPQIEIYKKAIEIRIKTQKPIIIKLRDIDIIIQYQVTEKDMQYIIQKICENSIYAYKEQISQGYITIKGGHRIGITGTCVIENQKISNIKYISSLNFRIAREVKGCSQKILKDVIDQEHNTIYNTLIVSPPGKGKTTILRDTIRNISNGIPEMNFRGKICGVVDERGEIAAMYKGIPQNDIGIRTDVIENVSKYNGMQILIRAMGPEVIACDEIGTKEDIEAIQYAINSGVKGIFTAHGKDIEEINRNPELSRLLNRHIFERIILLNPKKKGETECFYL